jgi:hypothetical protein
MAGLIWFIQIVHYPQVTEVGAERMAAYAAAHARLTTWVVAPLMRIEAVGKSSPRLCSESGPRRFS